VYNIIQLKYWHQYQYLSNNNLISCRFLSRQPILRQTLRYSIRADFCGNSVTLWVRRCQKWHFSLFLITSLTLYVGTESVGIATAGIGFTISHDYPALKPSDRMTTYEKQIYALYPSFCKSVV